MPGFLPDYCHNITSSLSLSYIITPMSIVLEYIQYMQIDGLLPTQQPSALQVEKERKMVIRLGADSITPAYTVANAISRPGIIPQWSLASFPK